MTPLGRRCHHRSPRQWEVVPAISQTAPRTAGSTRAPVLKDASRRDRMYDSPPSRLPSPTHRHRHYEALSEDYSSCVAELPSMESSAACGGVNVAKSFVARVCRSDRSRCCARPAAVLARAGLAAVVVNVRPAPDMSAGLFTSWHQRQRRFASLSRWPAATVDPDATTRSAVGTRGWPR